MTPDDFLRDVLRAIGPERSQRLVAASERELALLALADHLPRRHARTKARAKEALQERAPHAEWLRSIYREIYS